MNIGPIAGGFLAEAEGWRWVEGLTAIFTGVLWIINSLVYPETYSPVLLRKRADALSKKTGKVYMSKIDLVMPRKSIAGQFKGALSRPWILLFKEPIVFLTSIYMAIIYGTLYLCFAAFPIVFQTPYPVGWGWRPGVGGLSFVGIAIGFTAACIGTIMDNGRYLRKAATYPGGLAPPEGRLPPALVGSVLLPVGLFWFAWTNGTNIHWAVPIVGSGFFAAGIVLVFLSLLNYLIDACKYSGKSIRTSLAEHFAMLAGAVASTHLTKSYSDVVFAASALAANAVLRSLFGAVFPLFTPYMYEGLGIHWASSVPAFMALACLPFPFLFYKYGEKIRMKCKYAAEASKVLQQMLAKHRPVNEDEAITEAEDTEKGNGSQQEHETETEIRDEAK